MKIPKLPFSSISIITLLLTGLLFQCCKPDPEPQKYLGDYPLGEIKDYLYFQPGSQWVYECDSTLELDTQIMVSSRIQEFEKSYITYELINLARKSISHGVDYKTFYTTTDIPYDEDFPNERQYNLRINSSQAVGRDAVFFYPYNKNNISSGSSPTYYRGYLDSLKVLGKWYREIRIFEVESGSTFPRPKSIETWENGQMTIYWAKNIGIVRMFVWTKKRSLNTTFKFNWNLKEYNVRQV